MIDFKKDRLQLIGQNDIEAQDVETHIVFVLFGLAISVLVRNCRQTRDDRLHYDIVNIFFELFNIIAHFGHFLIDGFERAFVAHINFLDKASITC